MALFSWDNFFDAGGVSGIVALLWQAADKAFSYRRRPQLRIRPAERDRDLKVWHSAPSGPTRKVFTLEVANAGSDVATRCIAVLTLDRFPTGIRIHEPRFTLHWAGADVIAHSDGAVPVDIGAEGRRLDVAFTQEGQSVSGAWAGTMLSFSTVAGPHQSHLPPGEYEGVVKVSCSNGSAVERRIRLYSPTTWQDFNAATI